MSDTRSRRFSFGWMFSSLAIFIVVELFMAGLIGPFLRGPAISLVLREKIDALLNLGAYFIGGLIVGVVSPGVRLLEPAIAAALAVAATLTLAFFTPNAWLHFSQGKLLFGGAIAFFAALGGAHVGERWTERRRH